MKMDLKWSIYANQNSLIKANDISNDDMRNVDAGFFNALENLLNLKGLDYLVEAVFVSLLPLVCRFLQFKYKSISLPK